MDVVAAPAAVPLNLFRSGSSSKFPARLRVTLEISARDARPRNSPPATLDLETPRPRRSASKFPATRDARPRNSPPVTLGLEISRHPRRSTHPPNKLGVRIIVDPVRAPGGREEVHVDAVRELRGREGAEHGREGDRRVRRADVGARLSTALRTRPRGARGSRSQQQPTSKKTRS